MAASRRTSRTLAGSLLGRTCIVAVLALAIVLSITATAFGGVITYWSTTQPVGTVGTNLPVIVKGSSAYDGRPLQPSSLKLYVDGALVPRVSYTGSVLSTSLYVYYNPMVKFADGVRTFRVEVSDSAGRLSSRQWSATIAQAPVGRWVAPAAGATVYSGTPSVVMSLSDNTPGTTFTVNGAVRSGSATGPVVATFSGEGLAAGDAAFALSAEVPAGQYYLTATVADAAGNTLTLSGAAARAFTVEAPPAMSILQDCDSCHSVYRNAHPTPPSVDCMVCHPGYDGDHMEGTEYCWDCHWEGWHTDNTTLTVKVTSSCTSCHSAVRPDVIQHTPASVEPAHVGSCSGCHAESIVTRHAFTPDGSSFANQCDLCHDSNDPTVVAAISTGTTACDACHGGPDAGHEAIHTLSRTDSCASCHEGSSLTAVHIANGGLTCDTCHESSDPEVVAAIAANNLACSGCHVTAGVDFHPNMQAAHTAPASASAAVTIKGVSYGPLECSGCHGLELVAEHDKSTASSSPADCGACHPSPWNTLDPWQKGCAEGGCHTAGSSAPMHQSIDAQHDSPAVSCTTGSDCHSASSGLAALHANASTVVGAQTRTSCQVCHAEGIPATDDCATCHGFDAHPPHTVGGSCVSANCHVADAIAIHGVEGGPGCNACHGEGETPTFACRECHTSPHPNSASLNHGPVTDQCGSCHATSNIMAVHGDNCATCHPTPAGPTAVYAGGCAQAGCHPGIHADRHEGLDHGDGTDCGDCHWTGESMCSGCHSSERAKPQTTTTAVASYTGVAAISLTPVDQGSGGYTSGVKTTYFQLDGQELQSGTFVIVPGPASGTQRHSLEYWSTDNQYNTEAHHIIYFTIAAGPPDSTPPSGTMSLNGGAAYASGTATVNSDVTGCNAGMRVDPGTGVYGTWFAYTPTYSVSMPAGDGLKTVRVQYRDGGNNITTLTDTISVDRGAPSVSLAINAGATYNSNPAVTLNMSMSDAVSGLNQMQFSTNGSTWTAWEPWALTKAYTLLSGTGVRYAYVRVSDMAGNTQTAWDSISQDVVLPTGSVSVNGGAVYTQSTTVTLNSSVTDANSGINQMRFSNDDSTWSTWEAYSATKTWVLPSGDGTKIVYAQYSDRAGNVLAVSDAIVLGGVTDVAPPTGSVVINDGAGYTNNTAVALTLSATDGTGGSGVWDMRFSNDNSNWSAWEAYATSKAFTLASSGSTRTAYVQYRDAAGNVSTTYTDSIGFDASRPTAGVTVNGGAYFTDGTSVTLSVTGSDGMGGSGVTHMQFSNDGTNWSAWQTFASSTAWTLSAGTGQKTVYVQVRDAAGNVSYSSSDGIAYGVYHTLTYTAGANGTISGTSPQVVAYGGSATAVTAVPNAGYRFLGWSDGITANPRTDNFVAGDVNATAWFAPTASHTVQFLTDGNGYLTGGQWIQGVTNGGSSTSVTAYPHDDNTYDFDYWENGSGARVYSQTLQLTNVTASETWTAHFWYSGSCPFLFTWDGIQYRFEADEFAAGYLGLRTSKGYRRPNPIDYHGISAVPALKDGALEWKLVEERDEVDYLDQVKLYTVDAPVDRDVWVERSQAESVGTFTTLDKVIHTTAKDLEAPPSVTWVNTGQDVRDKVSASDDDRLILNENRNFAYTYQTLELDLGAVQSAPQVKLVIDGRTMIPTSAEGRAYSRTYGPQAKLEVQDGAGNWVAVPSSKLVLPKPPEFDRPFVLDVSNIWVSESRKVRLTYLYKTYIDSILLDTTADVPVTITELPLLSADLQPHGFDFKTGIGEWYDYVYGEAFSEPRYKLPGNYTKFGLVTPLLTGVDDKFVIFGGGDEVTMRFEPAASETAGTRAYVFLWNGYYKTLKEDIAHTVEPLPFAAMSNFPYPATESYPTDAEHQAYLSEWNTRHEGN